MINNINAQLLTIVWLIWKTYLPILTIPKTLGASIKSLGFKNEIGKIVENIPSIKLIINVITIKYRITLPAFFNSYAPSFLKNLKYT